jgi:hypothetical protein
VEERMNSDKVSLIRFKTKSKLSVDVFASRTYHQSIFLPVNIIEGDVLVLDVIELDGFFFWGGGAGGGGI